MGMRKIELANSVWDGSTLFDYGPDNCGVPGGNGGGAGDGSGGGSLSEMEAGGSISADAPDTSTSFPYNARQLFFRFHNHYFTPFILTNGLLCYYAFEKAGEVERWTRKLSNGNEYVVAIEKPIYLDNILRVLVTKKAELLRRDPLTGEVNYED